MAQQLKTSLRPTGAATCGINHSCATPAPNSLAMTQKHQRPVYHFASINKNKLFIFGETKRGPSLLQTNSNYAQGKVVSARFHFTLLIRGREWVFAMGEREGSNLCGPWVNYSVQLRDTINRVGSRWALLHSGWQETGEKKIFLNIGSDPKINPKTF